MNCEEIYNLPGQPTCVQTVYDVKEITAAPVQAMNIG